MKKLLILSGKGGTGKSTVAACFMHYVANYIAADCDVDAANLALLFPQQNSLTKDFYGAKKAEIDATKCILCETCVNNCRFNALKRCGTQIVVDEFKCEGCGLCAYLCPVKAITMLDDKSGTIKIQSDSPLLVSAELEIGRGNSGKLVTAVKNEAVKRRKNEELMIIDGAPGIGCPVIAAVNDCDFILIVTEASVSALNDLQRLLQSLAVHAIKTAVCINKADLNPSATAAIKAYLKEEKIVLLGEIPYDEQVIKALNKQQSIAAYKCAANTAIHNIYLKVCALMAKDK